MFVSGTKEEFGSDSRPPDAQSPLTDNSGRSCPFPEFDRQTERVPSRPKNFPAPQKEEPISRRPRPFPATSRTMARVCRGRLLFHPRPVLPSIFSSSSGAQKGSEGRGEARVGQKLRGPSSSADRSSLTSLSQGEGFPARNSVSMLRAFFQADLGVSRLFFAI